MKIDFVIPWVDGSDPAWQKEKNEYLGITGSNMSRNRYRDMGILKYWFRAVEAYAPWVNQIHFITWGHLPEWLNTEHPKLHIVNHKDYIPPEYLPTFSSHPIELNMHRIPGLSDHFVYFNDDMFLNSPVDPDFFFRKGKPCDFLQCRHIYFTSANDIYGHITANDVMEINRHHSYLKTFLLYPGKVFNWKYGMGICIKNLIKLGNVHQFVGFQIHHLPAAYCKQTLLDVWDAVPDLLDRVSQNRIRTPFDVSQSLFRNWQLASGQFCPVSPASRGKSMSIADKNDHVEAALNNLAVKMICINDTPYEVDFECAIAQIKAAYEKKLPQKSAFEK